MWLHFGPPGSNFTRRMVERLCARNGVYKTSDFRHDIADLTDQLELKKCNTILNDMLQVVTYDLLIWNTLKRWTLKDLYSNLSSIHEKTKAASPTATPKEHTLRGFATYDMSWHEKSPKRCTCR